MIEPRFAELLRARSEGILVTIRLDARPQLSNVNYAFDAGEQLRSSSAFTGPCKVSTLTGPTTGQPCGLGHGPPGVLGRWRFPVRALADVSVDDMYVMI